MGVYSWQTLSSDDQVKVCIALKNKDNIDYNEKEEVNRISQMLPYQPLTESDNQYMESLIQRYGSSLDIS